MLRLIGASVALIWLTGCRAEEWIVVNKRSAPIGNFWGRAVNFDGNFVTGIDNWPVSPGSPSRISITTPPPVFEVKDVTVTGWLDASGMSDCTGDACQPQPNDPVVTLTRRNWPFSYEITFTDDP